MLTGERLGVLQQEALNEIGREIAKVVPTHATAKEAQLFQVTASRNRFMTEVPEYSRPVESAPLSGRFDRHATRTLTPNSCECRLWDGPADIANG